MLRMFAGMTDYAVNLRTALYSFMDDSIRWPVRHTVAADKAMKAMLLGKSHLHS